MMTLIPDNSLLTEQLTASASYERIKRVRLLNIERATRYLNAAGEAARRYANRIKMVDAFDCAFNRGIAWTLVNTRKELLTMAMRNKAQHESFMKFYREILFKEITKP